MRCPKGCAALVRADKTGVEIDYCPECRGVWLDRGELDKIIQNSGSNGYDDYESPIHPHRQSRHENHGYDEYEHKHDDHSYGQDRRKRESFLGDLFDF